MLHYIMYIYIYATLYYVYIYTHTVHENTWYIYRIFEYIFVYQIARNQHKNTSTMVIVWGSKCRISSRSVPACTDGIRTVREHKHSLEMGFAIPNPS